MCAFRLSKAQVPVEKDVFGLYDNAVSEDAIHFLKNVACMTIIDATLQIGIWLPVPDRL